MKTSKQEESAYYDGITDDAMEKGEGNAYDCGWYAAKAFFECAGSNPAPVAVTGRPEGSPVGESHSSGSINPQDDPCVLVHKLGYFDCLPDAPATDLSKSASPENEKQFAIRLANKVLDRISGDPDDDLAVLSRQFLRSLELKSASPSEPRPELVIEICRELYDRFMMGGWEPQDAHEWLRGKFVAARASAAPLKETANESLQIALRELLDAANLVSYDEDPPDADGDRYEAARLNAAKTLASLPQPSAGHFNKTCSECGAWPGDRHEANCSKVAPSAGQTEGK